MTPSQPQTEAIPTETTIPQVSPKNPPLDRATLLSYLQKVPILASISEEDLDCLDDVERVEYPAGEVIAKQGETARYFYILLTGKVGIAYKRPDGVESSMAVLPPGSAFGELPLLANIQNPSTTSTLEPSLLLRLTDEEFWHLMTECPEVRKAILGNMAFRLQKMQSTTVQQEKMAALGTLAAGLMHELNNPGAAARRASSQLRENLLRMHELSARFTRIDLKPSQKQCLLDLQSHVLSAAPLQLNSLEQSDAEESLAEWMEGSNIENAWKLAPTLVSVGINAQELSCTRDSFDGTTFSDALNWVDALASSMQLVSTIEESIGRVSTLVTAVKSYAYEGKGQRQTININESLYATLVILGHKMREKQVTLEKSLDPQLPLLESSCSGLNQIWTNILDNAIDAVPEHGRIRVRTWAESEHDGKGVPTLCVTIEDDGPGIPLEVQPHIFDPFYTTKPVGVGTGLGLGIVYRIVESFGGTIRFSSVPGNTTFFVRIPAQLLDQSEVKAAS
ncbi:ATP-binding protein [Granulicella sibirica]|uniref:histidine kinase n=1 Tax=Granulicella sibirica TaxID=2479048 RepID=A0A4Q0SZW1_9BACT|nr:ATP-binding protein [Granulicella sibirica]RXH55972.1 Signal transduction histidine kinase [Granulicella sibirica]